MSKIKDTLAYTNIDAESRFIRLRTDVAIQIDVIREELNLSQRDFASKLGKTESYVSRLVSGTENLTLKTIAQVEHAFGLQVIAIPWVENRILEIEEIENKEYYTMQTGMMTQSLNNLLINFDFAKIQLPVSSSTDLKANKALSNSSNGEECEAPIIPYAEAA